MYILTMSILGFIKAHPLVTVFLVGMLIGAIACLFAAIKNKVDDTLQPKREAKAAEKAEKQQELNKIAGETYEINTRAKFSKVFDTEVFPNVIIPVSDKWRDDDHNSPTTEIDGVFVTPKGIFCIECKNYSQAFEGELIHDYWIKAGSRNFFPSPMKQNAWHIKNLKALLADKYPDIRIFNLVLLSEHFKFLYLRHVYNSAKIGGDILYLKDRDTAIVHLQLADWDQYAVKDIKKDLEAEPDILSPEDITDIQGVIRGYVATPEQRATHAAGIQQEEIQGTYDL